jgi:non-canonical (house-cleaning) NTP pyrophosphatase
MLVHISIGSKSKLKETAIINALMRIGRDFSVKTLDVPSGVPAQPFGDLETSQGAKNRAKHAAAMTPGSWGIGIESGLMQEGEKWLDMAAVAIVPPYGGLPTVYWSEALEFPAEAVLIAQGAGFATTTVGSVLAATRGCASDDPHSFLTGGKKSRTQFLTDAVEKALRFVWGNPEKEAT